jgi:hypothetical protein
LDELQSHFGCVYQPVSGEYEHLAPKIWTLQWASKYIIMMFFMTVLIILIKLQ